LIAQWFYLHTLQINGKGYNFGIETTKDEQRQHAFAVQEKIVNVCTYGKSESK
jgi:anti-sigma regulatory factor (Ser/Thr protein kinase)